MKLLDTTRRAGRSLRDSKSRTLLTSLAIAVGSFTIVLSLAAGSGGRQYAASLVSANADERTISVEPKQEALRNGPQEYQENGAGISLGGFALKLLSDDDVKKIAQVDGVETADPMYNTSVEYITREGQKRYTASVTQYVVGKTNELVAGSDKDFADGQVLIGKDYVKLLGFTTYKAAIGQTVSFAVKRPASFQQAAAVQTFDFKVVGVVDKNPLAFTSGASDIYLTANSTKQLYTFGATQDAGYFGASVRVKKDVTAETVKQRIEKKGYVATTAEDRMQTLFQFINVLTGVLIGFGALATLTAVFGIINTQYISVLERTQQIGLMKALGMRRKDVGRLFKLEAAWIGFLGGAIGAVAAYITGNAANPWINRTLDLPDGINLLVFEPLNMLIVVLGLMLISVLAGILPARKASKLDPIEALRTE